MLLRECLRVLFLIGVIGFPVGTLGASVEPSLCRKWSPVEMTKEHWSTAYEGFGRVVTKSSIQLQPRSIASDAGTHAALVLMKNPITEKEFSLPIRYHNIKALRTPSANPWEVFWLFFNYQALAGEKTTNYFIFKPNGVEIGKAWGKVNQEFLASAESPKLEMGKEYELILDRHENKVSAFINGNKVLEFSDREKSKLYHQAGQIGLYSEDSEVEISSVDICRNDH